jgi:hypothetical protein
MTARKEKQVITEADLKPKGRRKERMVRHVSALYHSTELDVQGREYTVVRSAMRGDTVALSSSEEARLDVLGALAAPGQTLADIEAAIQRTHEAYRAERSQITPEA